VTPYLDLVGRELIIFDGAMGSNLQLLDLHEDDFGGASLEGCNEALVFSRPDALSTVHASFLEVGVDVIETDTFGAFSVVLNEYGLAEKSYEINRRAAEIAREVASSYSTKAQPRFVAGSVGPGTKFPSLGQIRFADLRDSYEVQCRGLLEGGVDLIVIETMYDLLTAKAAIVGARRAMTATGRSVPLQVQVTIELTGRMLPGTEIGAALTSLAALRVDVVGINCATGPKEMGEHLRYLSQHTSIPLSCLPNAGLPSVVDGAMHYDLTPQELADYHRRFVSDLGVSVIGGCCGTTPAHLEAVVNATRNLKISPSQIKAEAAVSSLYSSVELHQELSYLAVGERTNANGSKRFREAMLAEDWDTCLEIAQEQTRDGAHLIDLCVDYTGSDGGAIMDTLALRLATQSTLPIMIDSTEANVVEAALMWLGGRPIINSVNLEDGAEPGTRLDAFLTLASTYGAAVVCTCIDEVGQARDAEWKLRAARAIYELATERYGLRPEDLIFDPLVLPISTGMEESRRDGLETIAGIKAIKENLPGCYTIIGLSNISFGLRPAAREVLNSVFLDECRRSGLDAAISHPSKIIPLAKISDEQRDVCLDLIYDRRTPDYDPLARLIEIFEGQDGSQSVQIDIAVLPLRERLYRRILDGNKRGLEDDLRQALTEGLRPLEIINEILLEAMKEVGELFGAGTMQLPFVLSSAEAMKLSVAFLEPYMERSEGQRRGRIVLATVKGDVHDIGKNLVDIILTNNGYEVFNLGIKISIGEMIHTALEVNADAIGMSGLLVKSTLIMRENLEELNLQSLERFPVILGGAALTRTYVERDLRSIYKGRLFYGKDAFEGLSVMNRLLEIGQSNEDDLFGRVPSTSKVQRRIRDLTPSSNVSTTRSPEIDNSNKIFQPPFLGTQVVKGLPIEEIATYLNETALYRHQWGYRPHSGESDPEFKERLRSTLRVELEKAIAQQVLTPMVAYGYFVAGQSGNDLVVFSDESREHELARFTFPRQNHEPYLCIADFFRPIDADECDYVAFHVVTEGESVSRRTQELFSANAYQDYLHLHGLGVEMAEALAEYWHHRIRQEWGFSDEDGPTLAGLFKQQYRGGRYSWGYPACPNLDDNETVVRLLGADRIGVSVSEGFQLHPEQSTTAIIVHHPQAKYFIA
jgi:5-methyltetrahydrofolate--homocysteine methyltransferase